jgi:hypothetical protein
MTYLRHAARHVQRTVYNYLTAQLTDLGWLTAGSTPYGLPVPQLYVGRPFIGSQLDNKIVPPMVAVSMGSEFSPTLEELGGPLSTQEYPIFCDVFMDEEGAAVALAADIRDAFLGRHATSKTSIPVVNQADSTSVQDWRLHFEDVERIAPEHGFPLAWQSVHVTASVKFPEVVY